jgi:hypothetical protein
MKRLTPVVLLAALSPAASFAEMAYSNVELKLLDLSLDRAYANVDGDAFAISGAYELNRKVFLLGEWQEQNYDSGVDGRQYEIGVGFHHAINAKVDFVGTVSYLDEKIDTGPFSVSDHAFGLAGGVRAQLAKSFELDGMLKHVDLDKAGSDTGLRVDGRWYFKQGMALAFGTDTTNHLDSLHVGIRFEF